MKAMNTSECNIRKGNFISFAGEPLEEIYWAKTLVFKTKKYSVSLTADGSLIHGEF